ncbi:MAG TPA: hypothetical protein VHB25_05615 [Gemmatimonadaceae bacterium]|nr:hypothetical protein [Gemmatimonadaceae bacterium]
MEFFEVTLEAHRHGATLYVAGLLAERAAISLDVLVRGLASDTRVLRVDLSAVVIIDPAAFVLVVRSLNAWRDAGPRQVRLEFPKRSARPRPGAWRAAQNSAMPSAVNTASNCPMSTSPG